MSGDTTSYWDPSGAALAQSAAELRSPAPRGRSVRHTQPGLTERFADQWTVWQTCSVSNSAAAAAEDDGPSWSSSGVVADALYLRLPLRLQENVHGSAVAAELRSVLGGGQVGLSLADVRKQVCLMKPRLLLSLLTCLFCSCSDFCHLCRYL